MKGTNYTFHCPWCQSKVLSRLGTYLLVLHTLSSALLRGGLLSHWLADVLPFPLPLRDVTRMA